MKTNKGQRAMILDRAAHCRHEMFADDVIALCDDMTELSALIAEILPLIDAGTLKDKLQQAVRV